MEKHRLESNEIDYPGMTDQIVVQYESDDDNVHTWNVLFGTIIYRFYRNFTPDESDYKKYGESVYQGYGDAELWDSLHSEWIVEGKHLYNFKHTDYHDCFRMFRNNRPTKENIDDVLGLICKLSEASDYYELEDTVYQN